jgi:hypothetical protein
MSTGKTRKAIRLMESIWFWDDFGGSDLWDSVRPSTNDRGSGADRWVPLSVPSDRRHGADWPIWRMQQELDELRQQARIRVATNSYAKGLLKNLTNNVVGKGFAYSAQAIVEEGQEPSDAQTGLEKQAQKVIDKFLRANNWNAQTDPRNVLSVTASRERQTFVRVMRDGEAFVRFHFQDNGTTLTRYIEPEQVRDFGGLWAEGWAYGIQHQMEPFEDIETVLNYRVFWQDPSAKGGTDGGTDKGIEQDIPADQVLHLKGPFCDSTVARGVSSFVYDTGRALDRAAKLQKNLSIAASVRAATAEIWQHRQHTQGMVAGMVAGMSDFTGTTRNGQPVSYQRHHAGQVRRIPEGQELIDLPTDQSESYRQALMGDLQQAASASCSPAFWLGDTENANYSNLESASAPAVREGQTEQEYYKAAYALVIWKAVMWAAECGLLPPNIDELITIEVEAPAVLHRNELEKTQEDQISVQMGWKDRETYAQERGLDWAKVQRNNDEWADQQAEQQQAMGGMGLPGEGGDKPPGQSKPPGESDFPTMRGMESVDKALLEAGFTGSIKDSLGRAIKYVSGKRVAGTQDALGGGQEEPNTIPQAVRAKLAVVAAKASQAKATILAHLDANTNQPGIRHAKLALGAALGKVAATQAKLSKFMDERYGKVASKAIFIAAQVTGGNPAIFPAWFVAIPGSTLLAQLPLIGLAEVTMQVGKGVKAAGKKAFGESVDGEEGGDILDQGRVDELGKDVATELCQAFFDELEPHKEELAQAFEGFEEPEEGSEKKRVNEVKDDTGHEHKGKGKGGGQFTGKGGGGGSDITIKPTKQRAFTGKSVNTAKISKQEAGKIGEQLVIAHLKSLGFHDARPLNLDRNNFPIDLVQDHESIEVKTGQVSNGTGAQQWRLTIGEPGKAEKAWLASAGEEEKAAWNAKKQAMITDRKKKCLADLSKKLGKPVKAKTMTVLLDPGTKTADIYMFDGWHDRIGWNSDMAKKGYVGSVNYG